MVIQNSSYADADEVRGLFNIFNRSITRNRQTEQQWRSSSSIDTNLFQLNNNDWAATTTGFTTTVPRIGYYKIDNAAFTLTSYPIPLLDTDSKVTVIPNYDIYKLYTGAWNKLGTASYTGSAFYPAFPQNSSYRTDNLSSEKEISFSYYLCAENDGTSSIKFFDGTNYVTILERTSSTSGGYNSYEWGWISMRIDWANERVFVKKRSNGGRSNKTTNYDTLTEEYTYILDISSLSTNLYLFVNTTNHSSNVVEILGLRLGKTDATTTITNSYSRDGGSNYTDLTQRLGVSTGSGTTITLKSTGTVAANEALIFTGWTVSEELP